MAVAVTHFADRVADAVERKRSQVVVGRAVSLGSLLVLVSVLAGRAVAAAG